MTQAPNPDGLAAARKAYAKRWMPSDSITFSSQAAAQVDYIIRAYLAAAPNPSEGEGWVSVPREPTDAMIAAGIEALREHTQVIAIDRDPLFVWRYMLHAAAPASPVPESEGEGPTHRHVKRGTEYVLIGFGKMQAEDWHQTVSVAWDRYRQERITQEEKVDMREVAIYRSTEDGLLWVRPREEFEDGRFVVLPRFPVPAGQSEGEGQGRRDYKNLTAEALAAVKALDDWANVNETEFDGWGDGEVPPNATWLRIKSGQALKALQEICLPRQGDEL